MSSSSTTTSAVKSRHTALSLRDLGVRFAPLAVLLVATLIAGLSGLAPWVVMALALLQAGATLIVLLGLSREAPLVRGVMWLTVFFLLGLLVLTIGAERTSSSSAVLPDEEAPAATPAATESSR